MENTFKSLAVGFCDIELMTIFTDFPPVLVAPPLVHILFRDKCAREEKQFAF